MDVASTVSLGYLASAAYFVGVAIYAWFLSRPEPEELAEAA